MLFSERLPIYVGRRSHTRISYDSHSNAQCLRSTLTGHFQSRKNEKNAQLAACYSLFPSQSMCKTITVDGEGKGVRGGKCGKPTNSLSFSITKSVATKHPVDVTSPHIAHGCRPMLQLHYRHRSDGWTVCDMWRARWGLYSQKVINGGRWYDDRTLSVRPTIAVHKRNRLIDRWMPDSLSIALTCIIYHTMGWLVNNIL